MTVGATLRVAGLAATALCVNPSDQIRFQGPIPVSAAWRVVADPLQITVVPETVAVGRARTVTRTVLLAPLAQPVESVTVAV